jgi:hypothetical protein
VGSSPSHRRHSPQADRYRKLADHGLKVPVTAEKIRDAARMGNFVIRVATPVPLTSDQTLGITRSVHKCLIHQTLQSTLQMTIFVNEGIAEQQGVEIAATLP